MALTAAASAVATIVLVMTRYSDADAQRQSVADGRSDGDGIMRQLPCSKNGKPYKTETKDIDT